MEGTGSSSRLPLIQKDAAVARAASFSHRASSFICNNFPISVFIVPPPCNILNCIIIVPSTKFIDLCQFLRFFGVKIHNCTILGNTGFRRVRFVTSAKRFPSVSAVLPKLFFRIDCEFSLWYNEKNVTEREIP